MNKDIQTLIEPNSIERWLIEKGFNNEVISRGRLLPYIYTSDAIIMYIQKVAFSLFKWRKVSDELPDADEAVLCKMKSPSVIVEGFIYNDNGVPKISTQADFEFEDYSNGEVTEWMPIPQID